MLGRSEPESAHQSLVAAQSAGWAEPGNRDEALLDLGSTSATLATVANIHGLSAVMHIGHPAQPSHDLERALLAAPATVRVTDSIAVPSQWTWVGRSASATGSAIVDESGMRDRRHVLRRMGATLRLVPARTALVERLALAGSDGSLVIEASAHQGLPDDFVELPGSSALRDGPPIWYGLVESQPAPPQFDAPHHVWLAFGPRVDHSGSLQDTLGLVADVGIDLQHLRSHRSSLGPHIFFAAFMCADDGVLSFLRRGFENQGVAHRLLAVLPGSEHDPDPEGVEPCWDVLDPQDVSAGR